MTRPAPLGERGLDYASRGWPVLPLHHPTTFGPKRSSGTEAAARCSCRRSDCEAQGKHPRTENGLDDATTDPDVIRAWIEKWPEANVGLRTGVAFDVLDLDGAEALDSLDDLGPPDGAPPVIGPMVLTGRGLHIYTEVTGAGNRAAMASGVDWRGRGGYVVAPPSVHHLHGDRYQWGDMYGIETLLAPVPGWLDDVVHKRTRKPHTSTPTTWTGTSATAYGARAMEAELGRLATAAEGSRNAALNTAAFSLGQLVAGGQLDPQAVASQLLTVAIRTGLGESEAVATIGSGLTSGMRSPRRPQATR